MNPYFSDWYRAASLTQTPELLDRKWQVVEKLQALDPAATVDLVVAALKPKLAPQRLLVRDAAKIADNTISITDATELSVLASSALADGMETSSDAKWDRAALQVRSSAFFGEDSSIASLYDLASARLKSRAVAIREEVPDLNAGKDVFELDFPTEEELANVSVATQKVIAAMKVLHGGFKALQSRMSSQESVIERYLRPIREQSDFLWLVQSGFAWRRASELAALAIDIAESVRFHLPPPNLDQLLHAILGESGSKVVNESLDPTWVVGTNLAHDNLEILCPLGFESGRLANNAYAAAQVVQQMIVERMVSAQAAARDGE